MLESPVDFAKVISLTFSRFGDLDAFNHISHLDHNLYKARLKNLNASTMARESGE